ncbi:MAG: GTP pyrophosphokinase [Fidelibacterota bacterium]
MKKPKLEHAIRLAVKCHAGQKDKGGNPYIFHPLRVMMKMETEDERIVAVLHDVIEDSDITTRDLRKKGYPKKIVEAVDALSKRKGERYKSYLKRVSKSKLAVRVKLEDLTDNMNYRRPAGVTAQDRDRLLRYKEAFEFLKE